MGCSAHNAYKNMWFSGLRALKIRVIVWKMVVPLQDEIILRCFKTVKQKWVPGVFPEGKGSRCVRLTILPPSYAVVMISGKLNFLEPSGPLQACNGTALPLKQLAYNSVTFLLTHVHFKIFIEICSVKIILRAQFHYILLVFMISLTILARLQ
jgi:hypothetical protein